ncbi:MAG: trigger factor [Vampirovibrionales bacterium]|nr:trigger factor [Vampirovibrionales bacterium]
MTVKSEINRQDKFLAKINLEIPPEQASQEYNKACRRLSQRMNIPGFRRGKAPRGVIEKTVGIDRIKQEAMDRLLPPAFADVISEHQLDIVAPPQIEEFKFDLAAGISIRAQVELRPDCQLPDLASLKVAVERFAHPQDAMDKEIKALLERMASLEPVVSRAAEAADIVNIDFSGSVDGQPVKGGSARNYRLDLANNNFIDGFAQQLIGHRVGEEFVIQVTFPEAYHDADLAGKPAEFKVKLNDIRQRIVPELNDDLVRKMGKHESVDAFREEVRQAMESAAERENQFRKQKALTEHLVREADVEIPESMVAREARLLMDEIKNRLRSQGHSWEQFIEAQGQEKVWDNLRSEAAQRIKTSLVFGAVAKQENIVVGEEEWAEQVRDLSMNANVDEKTVMRQLANNPGASQSLNDQILSQKIIELLCDRAKFEWVDAPPSEDAPSSPPAAPEKKSERPAPKTESEPSAEKASAEARVEPAQPEKAIAAAPPAAALGDDEEFEVLEDED